MKTSFHHTREAKKRRAMLEKKLHAYTNKILALQKKNDYTAPESSLVVAGDTKYQNAITKSLKAFKGVKHVVLVGIGGQSLGTEAVYRALAWKTSPTLTVIDSIEKDAYKRLEVFIKSVTNVRDVVLVVSSKSGTTTETMSNAVTALGICEKQFGETFRKQVIFVGDKDSSFYKIGKKNKALCIAMPAPIGGRYSIFTAAGIVPLTLLGIDTISLREGALDAVTKKEMKHREASAVTLALQAEAGTHTINFFAFNKRLELCGFWYRQLLAESIGKDMTTKGATFSHQILPIVSTSVDLHSMAQLYLGGYKNMYTHFVYYNERQPFHVRTAHWLLEHIAHIGGKTFDEINDAIIHGVFSAYDDQKLPYQFTELPKCSAYEIGFLMSSLMCEVMCFAHALNVDAFNQPSVELYKKHTRKALGL